MISLESVDSASLVVAGTFLAVATVALKAAYEDAREYLLRNRHTGRMVAIVLFGTVLAKLLGAEFGFASVALGGFLAALPFLVMFLIAPSSVGAGDIKFAFPLGMTLGWLDVSVVSSLFHLILVLAGPWALLQAVRQRSISFRIPLGPFMTCAWLGAIGLHVFVG